MTEYEGIANKNEAADFWRYTFGVNVMPANTRKKTVYTSWSKWQNASISEEQHKEWKDNNSFDEGMAIIPGRMWKGPYEGQYLVAIDCDNKKAIDEIYNSLGFKDIHELSNWTIVEQHEDDTNKAHIYIRSNKPFKKKSSDRVNSNLANKIDVNDIPAIEVKGMGEHGIIFCSPSVHKDGSPYTILGTQSPALCDELENYIDNICRKYGIPYLESNNISISQSNNNNNLIPIKDLFASNTKILKGHNRHEAVLRIADSLIRRNKNILSLEQIKKLVYDWNQEHCIPPLDDREFEKQWKQSDKFVAKGINSTSNNNIHHYNANGSHKSSNIEQSKIILPLEKKNYFEYVVNSIKKTVKSEDTLIRQILYTGFSTYVEDDPLNLGILAPTSEGKTYAITESFQYFPNEDVVYIGQMSPKVLVRQKGILIDKKTGEPIEDKIQELRTKARELVKKKNATKDKTIKAEINDEILNQSEDIRKLFEYSKTLINLTGKILVFLEPPKHELWELLKPILSHDKKEIEFPFVDKDNTTNAKTKDVVVRGYPACIFCSAKDESKWEIWNEIKSRILVTSPNMIQQKYQESNKLISQSKGLPNLIQQQIIISEEEIETTKNCVLLIKQKINELKSKNQNAKISLWIPYYDLLQKILPANKGTDVRFAKKIFSLLNIVPIVKNDLRMVLMIEGEKSIIADLDDLKEVLSITQNFDGLPKFKADFFNEIFYPCFTKKIKPDSNADGKKTEEIIAVTTRELCDYYREKKKKPISTDNLKHTYLNQFINEGIIDYTESKINAKQNIYYPLVTDSLSIESIKNSIDKDSQYSCTIYEKIIKNINETWIFCEIMRLIHYRLIQGNMALFDYINDPNKFQILDRTFVLEDGIDDGINKQIDESKVEEKEEKQINPITLGEFVKKYLDISFKSIDNKQSNILLDFAKRSLFLSTLAKIDNKDVTLDNKNTTQLTAENNNNNCSNNNDEGYSESCDNKKKEYTNNLSSSFSLDYLDHDQRVRIERHLKEGKTLKCHHDNCLEVEFSSLQDYNRHCYTRHTKQPLHPDLSLIEMLKMNKRGNPWEI